MIDFKDLEKNLSIWKKGIKRKGSKVDLNKVLKQYKTYSALLGEVEQLRSERNEVAKQKDIAKGKKIKQKLDKLEGKLSKAKVELQDISSEIPNLPDSDIPDGGEGDNKVLGKVGKIKEIRNPKDHIELGKSLNIIDIERGVKVSGSRFYFLKNQAVELEFALVRWVFDLLKKKEFELLVVPQLVQKKVMIAGGYLGQAEDEVYKTQDDLYLIGTSEQSILGYHMNEIIEVPKRYAAFSTCFRREAGSYGKDVKGIIRTHQFDKIEMFSYVDPKNSSKEHRFLVGIEEEILQALEIPYQKVLVAAGDLGMSASKKIDLESWIPSQKRYRETHSCSSCTDWQARQANIRFKENGKPTSVYTLNGTAIAIGRLLVALLENHQQSNGSVNIPKILHSYLDFKKIEAE